MPRGKPQRKASEDTTLITLILNFKPPEPEEDSSLLFKHPLPQSAALGHGGKLGHPILSFELLSCRARWWPPDVCFPGLLSFPTDWCAGLRWKWEPAGPHQLFINLPSPLACSPSASDPVSELRPDPLPSCGESRSPSLGLVLSEPCPTL